MIAVFCRYQRDFEELNPTPRKMFKRIRNVEDTMGIKFTGVIMIAGWYRDVSARMAHESLVRRQPDLFKENPESKA